MTKKQKFWAVLDVLEGVSMCAFLTYYFSLGIYTENPPHWLAIPIIILVGVTGLAATLTYSFNRIAYGQEGNL